MSVSLDGYIEGPDRDISWHRVDHELHAYVNEYLSPMSAFLSGRVSYELMAGFWPTADADPAASAPVREFAAIWRDKPKIVFSRTLQQAGWNTTIRRDVVRAEIEALTAQPGGDMALGGARLAAVFRRLDLIDEYRLYVNPVLLGAGTPLFPPVDAADHSRVDSRDDSRDDSGEDSRDDSRDDNLNGLPQNLRLLQTRTFGDGVVLMHYERVRASRPTG
jgi:dihydrofolate reductase